MNYYFLLVGFFCTQLLAAQTNDYLSIRDSILIAHCGVPNHDTILKERLSLELISVEELNKNQYLYYKDLGWNYYLGFTMNGDTSMLYFAIKSFDLSLDFNKRESTVLWNNALCSSIIGDCSKALDLLARYKACAPKRIWDKYQINWIQSRCVDHYVKSKR